MFMDSVSLLYKIWRSYLKNGGDELLGRLVDWDTGVGGRRHSK